MPKVWLHVESTPNKSTAYASVKTCEQVRKYFRDCVKELPCQLPESFSKLYVETTSDAPGREDCSEIWVWGHLEGQEECQLVDLSVMGSGLGWKVEVDDKVFFNTLD